MSTYEDQQHDCNSVCPYCGYSYQVEAEDYSEDLRKEECSECGKKYWLTQSFDVTHETTPDCQINGQQHQWEAALTQGYKRCSECGKVRLPVTEGERR